MRMIMHNWPDALAGIILRHARAIAGPETRLVIVDSVLERACRCPRTVDEDEISCGDAEGKLEVIGEEEHERVREARIPGGWIDTDDCEDSDLERAGANGEAPEPLLPNWGTANGLAYKFDLVVSLIRFLLTPFHSLTSLSLYMLMFLRTPFPNRCYATITAANVRSPRLRRCSPITGGNSRDYTRRAKAGCHRLSLSRLDI
jgi:hypothetical protein